MNRFRFLNLALISALALAGVASAAPRLDRGETAPDFTGTTLNGKKLSLSDYRGKSAVVLNFYADFCAPCRQEFPKLKELHERYNNKGLTVISVSMDEERQAAANIPNQHRVRFPVVFDPKGAIADRYGVQAIPHTVVIEKDGKINTILVGLDLKGLDRAVESLVK